LQANRSKENRMNVRTLSTILVVVVAMVSAPLALADPEDAAAKYTQGTALLGKGDFEGALKAYTAAVKADPDNEEYLQKATLVRRVIEMRKKLDKLTGEPWLASAGALRAFYVENRLLSEALPLDRQIHAKLGSAESAVALARTELALGMNPDAAELLRSLPKDQTTPEVRVLLGLALARQGKRDEAGAVVAGFTPPADTAGQLWFDLAGLHALTGDAAKALAALVRGFEATPPSQLDAARERVKQSADFDTLKARPDFGKACATASKVTESKDGAGKSCGKCPLRDKCAADKPDAEKKDSDTCKDHPQDGERKP
jgi:tetratricopeptide (TPR) repeat protein